MSIFITNNIEQECENLISMYTDIGYVKKRILQNYPIYRRRSNRQ